MQSSAMLNETTSILDQVCNRIAQEPALAHNIDNGTLKSALSKAVGHLMGPDIDLITLFTFKLPDEIHRAHQDNNMVPDQFAQATEIIRNSFTQAEYDIIRHVCATLAIERGELAVPDQPLFSDTSVILRATSNRLGSVCSVRENAFHFSKPFNPRYFLDSHNPIRVGAIDNPDSFKHAPAPDVLDMCVSKPGMTEVVIPLELAPATEHIIQKILDFWGSMYPDFFQKQYAYLTVDSRPIKPGGSQRVGGVHVDGLQGRRYQQKLPIEAIFLVASTLPTVLYTAPVDMTNLELSQHNFFQALEERVDRSSRMQCEENVIYLIDPYTPHESPSTNEFTERRFLRLEFGEKVYDRIGNTENPNLEAYAPSMKPLVAVPRPVHIDLKSPPGPDEPFTSRFGLSLGAARELSRLIACLPAVDVWSNAAPILSTVVAKGGSVDHLRRSCCLDLNGEDAFRASRLEEKMNTTATAMSIAAAFHNNVYLPAKKSVGQLYRRMTFDVPARLHKALENDYVSNSQSVKSFISDSDSCICKVYRRDILDVAAFNQLLGIDNEFHEIIQELPPGEIVLHSLYRPWYKLEPSLQAELLPRQLKGFTNLLTFCLLYEQLGHPLTKDSVTQWMNASYSHDNPEDPFSQLSFDHITAVEAAKLDWQVFTNFVSLMDFDGLFHDFLAAQL